MNTDLEGLPDFRPLARGEEPGRDLWPGIAAAIGKKGSPGRSGPKTAPVRIVLAAAALAASLVVGLAAGRSALFADLGLPGYVRTVNADWRKTERHVLYRLEGSALSEENIREIRENLRIMDGAAERLMELVRSNPDSRLFDDRIDLVNRERFEFLEAVRTLIEGGSRESARSPSI